jgi:beta-galactosidase
MYSRRNFLKTSASAAAAALLPSRPLLASIATAGNPADAAPRTHRLANGWEYLQGSLGGPWEAWHSAEVAVWQSVVMPHCFNAVDGCDPDVPYYRGNGWYRSHVPIANPFEDGRTLLHFEGAGQTTTVFIGDHLAGKHTGGYDEFVFDITDILSGFNAAASRASQARGEEKQPAGVPIAVLCDNSRDLDRMPSDLSDFSLYGGMYRNVNLVYVPATSLETLHVRTSLATPTSAAKVTVIGTLYNPGHSTNPIKLDVEVSDAKGTPCIEPPAN